MQVVTRMYIGQRNVQSHQDGADEFQPLITIEMGAIGGGKTLQLVNSHSGNRVRLYDQDSKELNKDGSSGAPLIAISVGTVQEALTADLATRDQPTAALYREILANLGKLLEESPTIEVVFYSYRNMRLAR